MIIPPKPIVENDSKVILFDLDGTLRHNHPEANETLFNYAVSLGAEDSLENRKRTSRWAHYYWAISPEYQEDVSHYKERESNFWENYLIRKLQVFGCPEEQALELAPAVREYMTNQYQPEDCISAEATNLLGQLAAQGYILGLITNREESVDDYLTEIGLDDYFQLALAAGEVQSWKPDPKIFEIALTKLGATVEQTVYVGDNYYADIVGAQRAGVLPVLYDKDHIFPAAKCAVINQLRDLDPLLNNS